MAGQRRTELGKLLRRVGDTLGRSAVYDIADASGAPHRTAITATVSEICKQFDYELEHFLESSAARVITRNEWNDVAETYGLERRKAVDDIFAELRQVL